MSRIAVVTDSSACLDGAFPLRVRVVPIAIHLRDIDLADGTAGAATRVYDALSRDEAVKSAPPGPLEYLSAIDESPGDAVVVITPAVEFTVMHRNARIAAESSSRPVAVIDSRTAAAAHGLVVQAACEAAESARTLDEVVRAAEDASRRADLVAALESLRFIRHSGSVPSAPFELAERLGVRPVFRLHEGVVARLGLPRTHEAALRRIKREWTARGGLGAERLAVFHAARPDTAAELQAMLPGADQLAEFSPAMGIHTGPGVVGVAWLRAN